MTRTRPARVVGGACRFITGAWLRSQDVVSGSADDISDDLILQFQFCGPARDIESSGDNVVARVPLPDILPLLPQTDALAVLRAHGVKVGSKSRTKAGLQALAAAHQCQSMCRSLVYVFTTNGSRYSLFDSGQTTSYAPIVWHPSQSVHMPVDPPRFPPPPLPVDERVEIIHNWCASVSEHALHESPCAVCGELTRHAKHEFIAVNDKSMCVLSGTDDSVCMLEQGMGLQPLPSPAHWQTLTNSS